jgi:DNA-binding NarL/FixJ family response regulator
MAIRVIIADDDALIRESLKMILELDEELEVVGACSNGDEAYKLCCEKQVDVVLMDIRMPLCDGITGTKKIKEACRGTKVLILTTFQDDEFIFQALKNGANGYMLKNTPSAKIKEQIKLVHGGTMLIHPEIAEKLTGMLNKSNEKDLSGYDLSQREIEITKLVSEGFSNREIADRLFLGESTVKNYISGILDKLNLRDRTQLAVFYLKK